MGVIDLLRKKIPEGQASSKTVEIGKGSIPAPPSTEQEEYLKWKQQQQTQTFEQDVKWFIENYSRVFESEPSANETIEINLLFGILIELKKLNDRLGRA